MNCFGAPAFTWFCCMVYVCFILNHSVDSHIGDGTLTLLMMLNFEMTDISLLLIFTFWQPVHVLLDEKEQHFPSKFKEVRGHFVGISEHIGHLMTFLVLLNDTKEIVSRSLIRSALDIDLLNCQLEANDTSNVHSTTQAEIMRNIEEKQTICNLWKLKRQQQTSSIDRTHACLDLELTSDYSAYNETNDVPNNFVHLRDDGIFNPSIHPGKSAKDAPL